MNNNKYTYNELIDFADISYFKIKEENCYNKMTIIDLIEPFKDLLNENKGYDRQYLNDNFSEYSGYEILKYQNNEDGGFYGIALKDPTTNNIIVSIRGSAEDIDWIHNVFETPNKYITSQGQYAAAFLEEVLKENADGKAYVVGHSLGGYLAQYAALENYKYIDRIEKVYGLDSLGIPKDVQKNYENVIDKYTKAGKIEVTCMTGVSQLYKQMKGITLTHLKRNDDLGSFEELFKLHPISKFRKLYPKFTIKKGELEKVNSIVYFVNPLANKVSLPRDRYKDIKTGLNLKITEKTDGLSVDEFLKKYNKNFKWDNGKIVEEIKTRKLKENPEYLVRGCVLECSLGSHKRRVDLRKCHGVYLKEGPVLHLEDSVVGEEDNIKSFGLCSRRNTSNRIFKEKIYNNNDDLYPECIPIIFENWLYAHDNTYIVRNDAESFYGKYSVFDLLNALTENSFLVCAHGGLIEPVTSGQEYEKNNIKDRIMSELGNQEEELVTLNSEGEDYAGSNIESQKVSGNIAFDSINDNIKIVLGDVERANLIFNKKDKK